MGTAYGQDCVSYPTVALWIRRFSNERESLEDDPRSGRPITAITQKNIDAIKDLVDEDPHISIDYMAAILDISHGSVDTILKQHLGLRKISSRWVPHSLTQEQRQRRVDILYRKVYNTSNIFS
jgi:histone-lysine N-methyltransferase SETMAR